MSGSCILAAAPALRCARRASRRGHRAVDEASPLPALATL